MYRLRTNIAIACALLVTGCATSISIHHDYDTNTDFSQYKTFGWLPQKTGSATGNARDAMSRNQLLDKRILSITNAQLQAKGLTIDTENPDLMLMYFTGLQDKTAISNYGYGYPRGYGAWGNQGIDVSQYTEGTLVIDFIDSKTKELVWRGAASGAIDKKANPDQKDAELTEAIAKLLAKYPPPTAK